MKKLLLMFVASMTLASCVASLDDDRNPAQSGEIEESYISINLMSADPDTRAADEPTFQEGLADERAVHSAYFFFFQNGQPFPVTVSSGAVTAPGTGANYLSANLSGSTTGMPNVSDVKNVVLMLRNYKGQYPNEIVAVLNWIPESGKSYSMADLKKEVEIKSSLNGGTYFVMSNAVYADAAKKAVETTALSIDNIFSSETAAKNNPVQIYVERAAAKVTVTTSGASFNIGKNATIAGVETPVYAKVTGWELYNDYQQSYLLKNIDPTWTETDLGFPWNNLSYYRSYWATSPKTAWGSDNVFTWNGGYATALASQVQNGTYAQNTYTYCGENTGRAAADRTKVILKAKLVTVSGETETALELARWYGTEYIGEAALRTAVANTLKYTYYYKVGDVYHSIEPTDLQCIVGGGADAPAGVNATEVYFQLSGTGDDKAWYKYSSASGYTECLYTDVNTGLKSVPSAVIYKNGQTYYYFDIKHLGASGKTAEYGIVRNHIYSINVNSISGFGSPIYDSASAIETPQYPDQPNEDGSFVSAQVNILSWRMVSQGVDIQPAN